MSDVLTVASPVQELEKNHESLVAGQKIHLTFFGAVPYSCTDVYGHHQLYAGLTTKS